MSGHRVNTVGIVGGNGYVGAQIARHLIKYAQAGKLKLVLFYRQGRPIKIAQDIKSVNIETRNFDLDWPMERLVEAVQGIHLCIAALAEQALFTEVRFVDALTKSSTLQVYIPSTYSITWNDKDFADSKLGPAIEGFFDGHECAKKAKLPVCQMFTGTFDNWIFAKGFLFPPIKDNVMVANQGMLENGLTITTPDHIGLVIAHLALTESLCSLANTTHCMVTFRPTGIELIKLFTELCGSATKVEDFTLDMSDQKIGDGPYGPVVVGHIDEWAGNSYEYGKHGMINHDMEYERPSLQEVAKAYL